MQVTVVVADRWANVFTTKVIDSSRVDRTVADLFLTGANPWLKPNPRRMWEQFNGLLNEVDRGTWRVADIVLSRTVPPAVMEQIVDGEDKYLLMYAKGFSYSVLPIDDAYSFSFSADFPASLIVYGNGIGVNVFSLNEDDTPIAEEEINLYLAHKMMMRNWGDDEKE